MTQQEFQQRYTYDLATDKLGEGGFGKVFKAYDNYLDKWVAMKISPIGVVESGRLKKEVEMVSKLPPHPNIARYEECYTFSSFDGKYDFGILQYYEEGNLLQLLKKTTLSLSQKQSLLSQMLDGIEFLHDQGIIHRDLKPQNILIVNRNGRYIPKITDFGISKQLDINHSSLVSNSIVGAGTLAYSSPEQLGDRIIRKNTDLWSFGVIAFRVFTGNLPFTTGTYSQTSEAGRMELFRQINSGKLPKEIDKLPDVWQTLVRCCLVTDPMQRVKDAAEAKSILAGRSAPFARPDINFGSDEKTRLLDESMPDKIPADTHARKRKNANPKAADDETKIVRESQKFSVSKSDAGKKKYLLITGFFAAMLVVIAVGFFVFRGSSGSQNDTPIREVVSAVEEVSNKTITRSDGVRFTYSGVIRNGLPKGYGKAVYPDGKIYEGAFIDGFRTGKGKMTFPDKKTVYEGDYVNDTAEGRGTMRYSTGERYEGTWKDNKQNGFGIYYDSNGKEVYRGQWQAGNPVTE